MTSRLQERLIFKHSFAVERLFSILMGPGSIQIIGIRLVGNQENEE